MSEFAAFVILVICSIYILLYFYILVNYWDDGFLIIRKTKYPIRFITKIAKAQTKYDVCLSLLKCVANATITPILPLVALFHLAVFYALLPDDESQI